MKKEYFTDNLSIETLAKFTDTMLNYEKTQKQNNTKSILLRVIPIAAAVVLVIGLFNILPIFNNTDTDVDVGTDTDVPGVSSLTNAPTIDTADQSGLFLPKAIEKSFFENEILAKITDTRALDKFDLYYNFKNPDDSVYTLDPNMSSREKDQLLSYLYEYTDLTRDDLMQMCIDNNITLPKNVDPAYSNIRFGDDENTLLLDIEWHTYDTFFKEVIEPQAESLEQDVIEWRNSDRYINADEEEKNRLESHWETWLDNYEEIANKINDKIIYYSRTINGKTREDIYEKSPFTQYSAIVISGYTDDEPADLSQRIDSDGYYIFPVYPRWAWMFYVDEDGEQHQKRFEKKDNCNMPIPIQTQEEYDNIVNNKIIPFCDDLLERGLIDQEQYDYETIPNWLDYFIDLWF